MKRLIIMTVLTVALLELGFLAFDHLQSSVQAHHGALAEKRTEK